MATSSYKLQLKFGTMSGTKTWNFNYGSTSASADAINNLMSTMITNGSIYKYPPLTKDSAKLIQTVTTEYDLNS